LLITLHGNVKGNGLFMHFCDSTHDITQMQHEEKQQHQRAGINFMLMRI